MLIGEVVKEFVGEVLVEAVLVGKVLVVGVLQWSLCKTTHWIAETVLLCRWSLKTCNFVLI